MRKEIERPEQFSLFTQAGKKVIPKTEEPPKGIVRGEPAIHIEEKIHCQYCEDVGPCTFCERGRTEVSALKKRR